MTLFDLFYDIGLHIYVAGSLPKILCNFEKYKKSFWQRLGRGFPKIEKGEKKLIWVHAVSLGETKGVAPLIKKLKSGAETPLILLSTSTMTGYEEGLKSCVEADYHVFLPFDFSYVIRPIVKSLCPDLLILMETDFWYNFQQSAKENGAQIFLINGKVSERSHKRLAEFPLLAKKLLDSIDHFFVQGDLYKARFETLKIPTSKLSVTGNLKLDSVVENEDPQFLIDKLSLSGEKVLTLGSTHDPEEKIWLSALKKAWSHFPHLKVLLVPRHPERFDEVAKLLQSENISFGRWSEGSTFKESSVILVDAMGVLRKCYQISDFAFVGGSLTKKVGGHNILEPAFYAKPVLFGPYMHSQPDLTALVKSYKAGLEISEETLFSTLIHLLSTPFSLIEMGDNGHRLIESSRGALDKTFNSLLQKINS